MMGRVFPLPRYRKDVKERTVKIIYPYFKSQAFNSSSIASKTIIGSILNTVINTTVMISDCHQLGNLSLMVFVFFIFLLI